MPSAIPKPQTLYDKVFKDHIVDERDDGTILLYIGESRSQQQMMVSITKVHADRHLVHEVTSPVSFILEPCLLLSLTSYSKLLKAYAMLVDGSEDQTARLRLPIM